MYIIEKKKQNTRVTKATGKFLKICILYNISTICTYINAKPPMEIKSCYHYFPEQNGSYHQLKTGHFLLSYHGPRVSKNSKETLRDSGSPGHSGSSQLHQPF